jgi:hypothetical protein
VKFRSFPPFPSPRAENPVLQPVISLLADAEHAADRIADLCRGGLPVDNELAALSATVAAIAAAPVPAELHARVRQLAERVDAATRAADARRTELAAELEQAARTDRVRRAYARPPS